MKILYYDCFAGISGDMNLGALIDLGVDPEYLRRELEKLNLEGYTLEISKAKRKGISGTRVDVLLEEAKKQMPRSLQSIYEIIEASGFNEKIKRVSREIFSRLANAEASVHGISVQDVHFHEIGAVDSIVDIAGAAICLDTLSVDKVMASSVELGSGFVECSHGTLPVPAPATTEILKGIPVKTGAAPFEMTTPTGAAILVSTVDRFTDTLDFRLCATGYGIGKRDPEIPNILRVMIGEKEENQPLLEKKEEAVFIECNIDDMNPEFYEYIMNSLLQAGAYDVYLTPVIMKKSRPAVTVSVLCRPGLAPKVEEFILSETTSLGLRKYNLSRITLHRDITECETRFGKVKIKSSYLGNRKIKTKPEYEDCRRLAEEKKVSLREIYKAVEEAELVTESGKK
ncbi:MAG: nickel pincer cofactor biosynthesis protein LarC [Syntrophales bacterium]|jgi:uncharacterized protein (TIGR00299 family) protein|nr:nickel pincer cofactor biosynthesis protein LarC [Syntrophales bacterium]MDY0043980.1 nickel pincer cofactor biosynthesis protein LarC [Syntrophales bacterium]